MISYHFRDKNDLMDITLVKLVTDMSAYVLERTKVAVGPRDKLQAYIEASIAYHAERPSYSIALIEILFHARTADNVPYYKLNDEDEDPLESELKRILRMGQETKEFGEFNVEVMVSAIRGSIDEYTFNGKLKSNVDRHTYSLELKELFSRAVR